MTKMDSLGRATFHHIAPQRGVIPTEREVRWFKHIERHGPQSTSYLFELTRDTHRCRDTSLRQMQKLRAGGYLTLPPQQRHIAKADFNPYIYDLTKAARDHLRDHALAEPTVRPQGHWWHSYSVSCVTSAIDIAADRHGTRFIPTHEILAIRNATLAVQVGRRRLIPDQLFALDYGGRYRAFALEVDRGTEPRVSAAARKSWCSSIDLYREVFQRRLWAAHYGLKTNVLVLWVVPTRRHLDALLALIDFRAPSIVGSTLVAVTEDARGHTCKANEGFWRTAWQRAGGLDSVHISC